MIALQAVRRATVRRVAAEQAWRDAIVKAVAGGYSHRAVGKAAGVSHTRVQQILREEDEDG
jgi:hypothetical protein